VRCNRGAVPDARPRNLYRYDRIGMAALGLK
jgi:hypothetical protein